MRDINVLDVTLRDGGCVIDFNFGVQYMSSILESLEKSDVEYVELGYLDQQKGSAYGRTQFINERVIYESFLKRKKKSLKYLVMIDYGKYDVDKLPDATSDGIDGIRLAFHKKDWKDAIQTARKIKEKGYDIFIQPMITMRYTDSQLLELIESVNNELPEAAAFYLVDSFGEMRMEDVDRMIHLLNHNLIKGMAIGFHSHNNLQLSYANAIALLSFPMDRRLMLDSSIMGMGKGAGNLNTELLMEHLNLYYNKEYKVKPLFNVIDSVLSPIHESNPWGYAVEFYLSSVNGCSPSYASYFYNKNRLSVESIAELLGKISEEKKISFDKEYAEKLYIDFNENAYYDDTKSIEKLRDIICAKTVLIIAPGKSLMKNYDEISRIKELADVSIALNYTSFASDYVLITREEAYEKSGFEDRRMIVTSNLASKIDVRGKDVIVVDYKKWTIMDEKLHDSAGIVSINLLKELKPAKVFFAGMDGFSINIDENYCDKTLRRKVSQQAILEENAFIEKMLQDMEKSLKVEFVTPSLYKELTNV